MNKRRFNNKAVTPVIGNVLMISIMITSGAVIAGWGLPLIEKDRVDTEISKVTGEFKIADELAENLIYGDIGSTATSQISINEGSISVDSEGDRILPIYSLDSDYDISLDGFDDDDNEFSFDMGSGSCDEVVVHWDLDRVGITGVEAPSVHTDTAFVDKEIGVVTLNGYLESIGSSSSYADVTVWFEYCINYDWGNSIQVEVPAENLPEVNSVFFYAELDPVDSNPDLDYDVEYKYRAVAFNGAYDRGDPEGFSINNSDGGSNNPVVKTKRYVCNPQPASCNVDLEGYMYSFGSYEPPADVYFGWGSSNAGGDPEDWPFLTASEERYDDSTVTKTISGLSFGSTYWFTVFADTDAGTVAGVPMSISTPGGYDPTYVFPEIHTQNCIMFFDENGDCETARLNGIVTDMGSEGSSGPLQTFFVYNDVTTGETQVSSSGTTVTEDVSILCGCSYEITFAAYCPKAEMTIFAPETQTLTCPQCTKILQLTDPPSGNWAALARTFNMQCSINEMVGYDAVYPYFEYKVGNSLNGEIVSGPTQVYANNNPRTGTGIFSKAVSIELFPMFPYFVFRAFVEDGDGTLLACTSEKTVLDPDLCPGVTCLPPLVDYDTDVVTFKGVVTSFPGGESGQAWFEWQSPPGMTSAQGVSPSDPNFEDTRSFEDIGGPGDYRVFAYAQVENVQSPDQTPVTFTIGENDPRSPEVNTGTADVLGDNTVTLHGTVVDCGNSCLIGIGTECHTVDYWFEYSAGGAGWSSGNIHNGDCGALNGQDITFSETLTDLDLGTTYYYKACARNTGNGLEGEGDVLEFTTDGAVTDPEVTTGGSGSGNTIYMQGTLNDDGYSSTNPDCNAYFYFSKQGCFLAGTKVTMADGSYKNIEDVKIGDLVKTYDEVNNQITNSKVTDTYHHTPEEMTDHYLIINGKLKVTPNHLLYINNKWEGAGEIKIGDTLSHITGEKIRVNSIEREFVKVPTYNLEVKNIHNYFAEDILVHNEKCSYTTTIPAGIVTEGSSFFHQTQNLDGGATYTWKAKVTNPVGKTGSGGTIQYIVPSCILEGTKIGMADGSYRLVEDLGVGDIVKSYDQTSEKIVNREITNINHLSLDKTTHRGYYIINNGLEVTATHKIYANNKWIRADELKIGDWLLNENQEKIRVFSIQQIFKNKEIYDISVEEPNTYFADGILVHNYIPMPPPIEAPNVDTGNFLTIESVAILNGELTDLGSAGTVEVYFEYGPKGEEESTNPQVTTSDELNKIDKFTGLTESLTSGEYFYRAIGRGDGVSKGENKYFTIDLSLTQPDVNTLGAVVTGSTVQLKGELISMGDADSLTPYFEWGNGLCGDNPSYPNKIEVSPLYAAGEFSKTIESWSDGLYHYRATVEGTTGSQQQKSESSTDVLDQQNIEGAGVCLDNSYNIAQTFTAGSSGPLSKISLSLKIDKEPADIIVYITDENLDEISDEVVIPGFSDKDFVWKDVKFDNPVTISAGTKYGIVVKANKEATCCWQTSDSNTYADGDIYVADMFGIWRDAITDNDFLFKTYIATQTEGGSQASPLYGEGTCVKFNVYGSSGSSGDASTVEYAPTDEVITFSSTNANTIYGYYADSAETPTADYSGSEGENSTVRNFIAQDSVGGKGICIDFFDSTTTPGVRKHVARAFLFDQGQSKYSISSSVGNCMVSCGGGTVISSKTDQSSFMHEGPQFIKINDDEINIRVVCQKSNEVLSKSGSGTYTFTTKLENSKTRDIQSPSSFKMQIYKEGSEAWLTYLDTLYPENQGFERNGHELVWEDPTNLKLTLKQTIFDVKLQ